MPKHIVQSESQIVSAKWSKWSDIPKKTAVLMDFVQITSPLPPTPQLFLDAKNDNLSDIQNYSLSNILLKLRPNTCFAGHVYNLKKSSNYWHFGGNRLHLLTKNALMKRCQKNWAGPSPPSFG